MLTIYYLYQALRNLVKTGLLSAQKYEFNQKTWKLELTLFVFIVVFSFWIGGVEKPLSPILGGSTIAETAPAVDEPISVIVPSEKDPVLGSANPITMDNIGTALGNEPFFNSTDNGFMIIDNEVIAGLGSPDTGQIISSGGKPVQARKNQETTYVVVGGDTISSIAKQFGVSVGSIMWANNLKAYSKIYSGDKLLIPPANGVYYTVQKGDTISGIAKRFGAKTAEISDFNNLSVAAIKTGTKIFIPNGTIANVSSTLIAIVDYPSDSSRGYAVTANLPDLGGFFAYPTTGWNWGVLHPTNAVDIANSCGTPIYAAADGIVIEAYSSGWNGGYGKFVKIQHLNGVVTLYAHMSSVVTSGGQNISQGTVIGYIGRTGKATGCHLHFEVRGAKNPFAS